MRTLTLAWLFLLFALPLAAQKVGSLCIAETNDVVLEDKATFTMSRGGKRTDLTPDEPGKYADIHTCRFSALPAGQMQLRIERSNYEPLDVKVTIEAGRLTIRAVTLVPTKDNFVQGRVVDDKGKALSGAQISIWNDLVCVSDRAGKFRLAGAFRSGDSCTVSIEAEGFDLKSLDVKVHDGTKNQDVELKRATRIYGKVTGLTGATARVQASWGTVGKSGKRSSAEGELAVDGTYSVTLRSGFSVNNDGGDVDVVVTYAGLECKEVARRVNLGTWKELDLTCSTKGTGSLAGTVLGIDGKPLGGVTVKMEAEGFGRDAIATTDSKGKYLFPVVPEGSYRIEIAAQNNRGYRRDFHRLFKVSEGKETRGDIDYTGTMLVRCRFVTATELIDAVIVDGSSGMAFYYNTSERLEGWGELYGAEERSYQFRLQGKEKTVLQISIQQTEDVVEIDRHLQPVIVSGKLKFPGAKPANAGDWEIELYQRLFVCKTAKVDADGKFELLDVTPGEYHIAAQVPGYYSQWLLLNVEDSVDIELEMQRAASVRVTVKFNGVPCSTLTLGTSFQELEGPNRPLPWREVRFKDGEAFVVMDRLPPGKTSLGFRPTDAEWNAGFEDVPLMDIADQEVELKAGEIADVTVTLELAAALEVEGLPDGMSMDEMWLEDEEGKEIDRARGYFSSLKTGTYYLVIEKPGYKKFREKVELVAGKVTKMKVKLERDE